MRLTNYMRRSFVNAVMADIPNIDYREMVRKLTIQEGQAKISSKVLKALQDPDIQPYLKEQSKYVDGFGRVYGYFPNEFTLSDEAKAQIEAWLSTDNQQAEERNNIRIQLTAIASSCSTVEKLHKNLPEFEKYMPKQEEKQGLEFPIITSMIADMTKLGWPAGAQAA